VLKLANCTEEGASQKEEGSGERGLVMLRFDPLVGGGGAGEGGGEGPNSKKRHRGILKERVGVVVLQK